MTYWDHFFLLLRTFAAIWAAFFLFSGRLPHKERYWPRLALVVLLECAIIVLFPFAYADGEIVSWRVTLAPFALTTVLGWWGYGAHKVSMMNVALYAFLALLTQDLADGVFYVIYFLLRGLPGFQWLQDRSLGHYVAYYLVLVAIYLLVYRLAGSKVRLQRDLGDNPQIFLLPLASTLIAFPLFGALRLTLTQGGSSQALAAYLHVLYDVTIIAYCYILLDRVHARLEASALQRTQEMERKQYEQLRESMEAIRLTSHDLKYQLRCLRETGGVAPQQLREAEQALEVYESVFRSGNRALDLILSDRRLRCEAKKIDFTCMADAASLDFMEPGDVYSLFCNALDNAIEYEETVQDAEERFIHLSVRPEGRLLFIHVENYYTGPDLTGMELSTHKPDKNSHGYGLKSIQKTVDRYGGQMKVQTSDGLFELNIVFPLEA